MGNTARGEIYENVKKGNMGRREILENGKKLKMGHILKWEV
jgi:hypothetical protein